jgi:hypothetical protein
MNFGTKTQKKIRKIIASTLGLNEHDPIGTRNCSRKKGYNTVMVRYEAAIGDYKDCRKPEAGSKSFLVPLRQCGTTNGGFLILEKYWVEIPKNKALTILSLKHLPDAA